MKYTDDNTEGYTDAELQMLNDRFVARASDDMTDDELQRLAEIILRDYDTGREVL